MKNIELYEFFNLGNREKERVFKILHSDKNGIALETDFFEGCYQILPSISSLEKPESDILYSVIIFFKEGNVCAGFDTGVQTVVSDAPHNIIDQNIFEFIRQFNVHI